MTLTCFLWASHMHRIQPVHMSRWYLRPDAPVSRLTAGSKVNMLQGVLRIPQSSSITGTSQSDYFVSYPGHSLGRVLPLCRGAIGVFYSPSRLGKYAVKRTNKERCPIGMDGKKESRDSMISTRLDDDCFMKLYIYIYIIKINGNVDKPTRTTNSVMIFRSLFRKRTSSEWNCLCWFINSPTYFYHLVRFTKIYHFSLSLSLYIYIYIYINENKMKKTCK